MEAGLQMLFQEVIILTINAVEFPQQHQQGLPMHSLSHLEMD